MKLGWIYSCNYKPPQPPPSLPLPVTLCITKHYVSFFVPTPAPWSFLRWPLLLFPFCHHCRGVSSVPVWPFSSTRPAGSTTSTELYSPVAQKGQSLHWIRFVLSCGSSALWSNRNKHIPARGNRCRVSLTRSETVKFDTKNRRSPKMWILVKVVQIIPVSMVEMWQRRGSEPAPPPRRLDESSQSVVHKSGLIINKKNDYYDNEGVFPVYLCLVLPGRENLAESAPFSNGE